MDQFKKGAIRILISTDVTCKGIDVPSVNIEINYDMPTADHAIDVYIQRLGRLVRGENKKGIAINFVN